MPRATQEPVHRLSINVSPAAYQRLEALRGQQSQRELLERLLREEAQRRGLAEREADRG